MKIERVKIEEINYINDVLYREEFERLYELNKKGIFLVPLMKTNKGYINMGFDSFIKYMEDRGEKLVTAIITTPQEYIEEDDELGEEIVSEIKEIFRKYLEYYRKLAKRIIG